MLLICSETLNLLAVIILELLFLRYTNDCHSTLLTDHLITGLSLPRKSGSSQTIHTYKLCWVVVFETFFGCHGILILGKGPIKWRQSPGITIAVDRDVKHQFKELSKIILYSV